MRNANIRLPVFPAALGSGSQNLRALTEIGLDIAGFSWSALSQTLMLEG